LWVVKASSSYGVLGPFLWPLLKRNNLPPAVIAMVYRIGVYGFLLFRWWLFVIPGIITIFALKFNDFINITIILSKLEGILTIL
jgi:p-aminobenzoyl-glutamate transporter AbgT